MAALNGGSPEDVRRAALSPRPKGRGKSCYKSASKKISINELKQFTNRECEQTVQRIPFAGMSPFMDIVVMKTKVASTKRRLDER